MSGPYAKRSAKAVQRPSIPGPGSTVVALTEERAAHVRHAVTVIQSALGSTTAGKRFYQLFGSRWQSGDLDRPADQVLLRAAWALASQRIVGRLAGAIGPDATLRDTEAWFGGKLAQGLPSLADLLTAEADNEACRCLERVSYDSDFADLLPYILDVHGPGSRASVLRNPQTRKAREAKREGGVYYTPADVAEYQAKMIADDHRGGIMLLRCLDPASGSGVYLRAMLRVAAATVPPINRLGYVTQSLYGFDISSHAIEASCFVLLYDCLSEAVAPSVVPWCAWHAIRLNFACVDSLTVVPGGSANEQRARARRAMRSSLLKGRFVPQTRTTRRSVPNDAPYLWATVEQRGYPLHSIFPEAGAGFELLVGNPPYAPIGERPDALFLYTQFASLSVPPSPKDNLYPLFIEMMWRLVRPGCNASSLVVPLSIAYHRGGQFERCRRTMMLQGGRWRCAFFDREPHALFGEDVKTRNAILFRDESPKLKKLAQKTLVETSPMRKWTSRTRGRLFASVRFTPLVSMDISKGIPKLDGPAQVHAAASLLKRINRLARFMQGIRAVPPAEAFAPTDGEARVFVGGTAYNFLNVFREHRHRVDSGAPFSTSPLTALLLREEGEAWQTLAILSSRLVFWWWHVHCDGFHVPRWFIENVPFDQDSFTPKQRDRLAEYGERLWERLQDHQIISLNRGRLSIAYRPFGCERERNEIDSLLIRAAGLDEDFAVELRRFVREVVIVDETDERRAGMGAHFKDEDHDRERDDQ